MDDIPAFEDVMLPLLEYASDEKEHSINETEKALAKKFNLSKEKRTRKKPSGYEPYFLGRIRWARLYLRKAGLIADTKKAHYKITKHGIDFLNRKPKPKEINTQTLMNFEEFKKWKKRTRVSKKHPKEPLTKELGLVVLLDFLGTKEMRDDPEQRIEKWEDFILRFENDVTTKLKNFKPSFDAFSDTIIITLRTEMTETVLLKIPNIISTYLVESMIMKRPLRGCISIGTIRKNKSIILGTAINEAEEYYELPQWIGVSATASAYREIEKLANNSPDALPFKKTNIPLKSSIELDAWAVDWTDFGDPAVIKGMAKTWCEGFETMEDVFYGNMKNLSSLGSSLKWRNTLKFFENDDS